MSIAAADWSRIYRREKNIVTREIAGETILVPIRGKLADMQNIFTLNTVGAFIWNQLDGTKNLSDVQKLLLDEFDVTKEEADKDLPEFINQIVEAGLAA